MINIYNDDCYNAIKKIPDNSIDLIVTDPPYLLSVNNSKSETKISKSKKKCSNDISFMANGFNLDILKEFIRVCKTPNMYIFCSNKQVVDICVYFKDRGITTTILVWYKTNAIPAVNNVYRSDLEYIIYVRGDKATFNNGLPVSTYTKCYQSPLIQGTGKVHPAQKPVELISNYIKISSNKGDTILDPFCGSGTTSIACSILERNFIGFEIDKDIYEDCLNHTKDFAGLFL